MEDRDPAIVSTRGRLRRAARRLFALKGLDAVSVREIQAEAGERNGASVNYHFGSKDGLIEQLVVDLFQDLEAGWNRASRTLPSSGRRVRQVVRIIVEGIASPNEGGDPIAARLIMALLTQRRRMLARVLKERGLRGFEALIGDLEAELGETLPPGQVRQRLILLTWYLAAALSARETALRGERLAPAWTEPDALETIIDTAVGLLTAPLGAGRPTPQP